MEDRTLLYIVIAVISTGINVLVSAKPAIEMQQGPCVGMDCLHGVLMHGDAEQGEDHVAEDQYLRFQEALKTEQDAAGPTDAAQEYHGVLMHGDSEPGQVHEDAQNIQPEVKQEVPKPKDMNEVLHEGMHGAEGVHKHEWDNEDGSDEKANKNAGDHEKIMHDILMHGGESDGEGGQKHAWDSDGDDGKANKNAGDHEKILHGMLMHGDESHGEHRESSDSESDSSDSESSGPVNHKKLMHGLLMHGDINFEGDHSDESSDESSDETGDVGPRTADDMLHGVLMHGDKEPGKHHRHHDTSDDPTGDTMQGPRSDQLHGILMHGDSKIGHDHTEEDAAAAGDDVFSDMSKILEMGIDPDILKIVDLEKILKKDLKEYNDWKINNPDHEDAKIMGSTYIDKSLLADIALMKQRYLDRDDNDDIAGLSDDDIPFTAEDANSVLNEHALNSDGEDMRHDLELMGSTDPINYRHAGRPEPHDEA